MTAGPYRPRGTAAGTWLGTLHEDRLYSASATYYAPSGRFGYGLSYNWGQQGGAAYANVAPSIWLVPSPHFSLTYSYERARSYGLQDQSVLTGSWDITSQQAISARWVQFDGSHYYRLAYRRVVRRGVDAFVIYDNEAYTSDSLHVKLVWSLFPFSAW
jgi:hypothetical protein